MIYFVVVASFLALCAGLPATEHELDITFPNQRIIGGEHVSIEDFPFQLSLHISGRFTCGASIITVDYALTAAHCIDTADPDAYELYAGSSILGTGEKHKVKELSVHPLWNANQMIFDVAVLKVAVPFTYNSKIQPISVTYNEPAAGEPVTVSGWGDTVEGGNDPSHDLLAVTVPVVDRTTCDKSYPGIISESMICAGREGRDSCQGDSGGPLILGDEQVGIVSFGSGCGRKDVPGVYTNLAQADIQSFLANFMGRRKLMEEIRNFIHQA